MIIPISDEQHNAILKRIKEEPGYAKKLIRTIMGPPRRELVGEEYEKIWTLLKLIDPVRESNNQRSITEEYYIGKQRYDVHYGIYDNPMIEEVDETDS